MKNMTMYKWKCFFDKPIYLDRDFKKFSAVIATAAILSTSGIKIDEVVPFVSVSSAFEYGELSILDGKNNELMHMDIDTRNYISSSPSMVKLLDLIALKIPEFFTYSDVLVELIYSPEECQPSVCINVISKLSLDKALAELRTFDNNWWLDFYAESKEQVSVDVMTL